MASIGKDILRAKSLLESGRLVAIPTETVYGLAGNGFDADAVASIFATKERPGFDPLILHTNSLEKIEGFVENIPDEARLLASKFWPGPLTILFKKKQIVPDLVTSGLDTVAVRIPRHPLTFELLESLEFPVAAPSANPFGYVSPTNPDHVDAQLGSKIPYILDGGTCTVGVESTIVSFESGEATVLRMGGVDVESLEEVLGSLTVRSHSTSAPTAPGMLKSHYAPTKSFVLIDSLDQMNPNENEQFALLSFDKTLPGMDKDKQFLLAPGGNVKEAAKNLFSMMRSLDERDDIDKIFAMKVPEYGLGRAVNDRLRRAAARD